MRMITLMGKDKSDKTEGYSYCEWKSGKFPLNRADGNLLRMNAPQIISKANPIK